jgi:Fuc2NAc and GlcNAc transferase
LISQSVIIFLASALAGWVLVGAMRILAVRWGLVDLPNARSSHAQPTARGGGLAIVLITLTVVVIESATKVISVPLALAWLLGGGLIAAIGLLDDLLGLPAIVRGGVHVLSAAILLAAVGLPVLPALPLWPGLSAVLWVVAAIVIVWSINLFNFMDGIDGLAAAQCVFVVACAALLLAWRGGLQGSVLPPMAMAGAAAGFLIWNAPPARIFMGDVGSGFIGFGLMVGALGTSGHGAVSIWTWLVLDGLFAADATVTVLSRLLQHQRVYEAHRLHVYQKLARRWSSHGRVTVAYMAINLIWCLPWAIATVRSPANAPLLALAALCPLLIAAVFAGGGKLDA